MKYTWSILDVFAENALIVQAKYKVTIDDGANPLAQAYNHLKTLKEAQNVTPTA